MRRFRFKFETLEKVRKTREDDALRVLADAQGAFHEAMGRKDALLRELDNSLNRRQDLAGTSTHVISFQLENEFISGTRQRVIQADQGILRAKRGVEKALRAYLHARRQTRMIEVLREKAYAEFKHTRAKQEQKDLDDLYVMRARLARETA